LTTDFGAPLTYKLALIHLLMDGEVVVQMRPCPIQVLVADVRSSSVEVCKHVTATRPCMLHHMSHDSPSFTSIFTKEYSTAILHCQNGVASYTIFSKWKLALAGG
jgi:hypothetical protein